MTNQIYTDADGENWIQRPHGADIPLPPNPFWIEASNIHNGTVQHYGPYEGPPGFTYEYMRALGSEDQPAHIFGWFDPQDVSEDNPHGYDEWEDSEGHTRYDGWRALRDIIDRYDAIGVPVASHTEPYGPFWTDLFICDQEHPHG